MIDNTKKPFEVFGDFKRQILYAIVTPITTYYYNTYNINIETYRQFKNIFYDLITGTGNTKVSIGSRRQ